ncbi:sushi, von Willebrand factor type A, EGF and pentraxin domain-containing protein 1-like isoform X2 [Anneissia japonica]|uniref:sushi, von Willebrand factor type A, EGF and pentraxin domain-containing protein 1-like isoform X2 n=1 Tax=Anneissia japonica TaxID=1529436 RepID=UPI0014254CED|nr:sushi, von Willebrand factor type A, EGF and pentraxin domain-containing protein 1-like isoform X2 [Anneissia japonica]
MRRLIYILICLFIPYVVMDTTPSSITVEEDCGMPTINVNTVVNVNYRYDLDRVAHLDTKFPSGTILITRCYDIGKYQLINGGERVCTDGSWTGFPATCNWLDNRIRFVKYGKYKTLPRQVAPNSSYIMNIEEGAKLKVECGVKDDAELRFEPFTGSTQLQVHGDRILIGSKKIYYVIDSLEHSGIYTCWDKDNQDAPPIKVEVRVVDPIYCSPPPTSNIEHFIYSKIADGIKFPLNAELTYFCPQQYSLIGETKLKCLYDGLWDFEFPHCMSLSCESPPLDIDHGIVIGSGNAMDTEIGIYCETGFHIPGTEEGKLKSVCTDGEWVPALPSDCKNTTKCENVPVNIANGFIVMKDDTNGTSVTIICNKDAFVTGTNDTRTTIRCVDGKWDHPFPSSCKEPTCPPPPLTLWNGIVRRQGNTLLYICDDGYYIPTTSDVELVVTCENEEWDKDFPVGCVDSEEGLLNLNSFSSSDDESNKPDESPQSSGETEIKIEESSSSSS